MHKGTAPTGVESLSSRGVTLAHFLAGRPRRNLPAPPWLAGAPAIRGTGGLVQAPHGQGYKAGHSQTCVCAWSSIQDHIHWLAVSDVQHCTGEHARDQGQGMGVYKPSMALDQPTVLC